LLTTDGVDALLAACPAPDILINNNGGPPYKDFRELDRAALLTGLAMNMLTPIELIRRVIDGMAGRGFGRIVNVTSSSVKMPLPGLDLSSGARAGLTAFVAGVARTVADRNVTIELSSAAKEFLASLGVDPSRIHTISNGKEKADGTHDGTPQHPPSWAFDRNDSFVYVSGELHP